VEIESDIRSQAPSRYGEHPGRQAANLAPEGVCAAREGGGSLQAVDRALECLMGAAKGGRYGVGVAEVGKTCVGTGAARVDNGLCPETEAAPGGVITSWPGEGVVIDAWGILEITLQAASERSSSPLTFFPARFFPAGFSKAALVVAASWLSSPLFICRKRQKRAHTGFALGCSASRLNPWSPERNLAAGGSRSPSARNPSHAVNIAPQFLNPAASLGDAGARTCGVLASKCGWRAVAAQAGVLHHAARTQSQCRRDRWHGARHSGRRHRGPQSIANNSLATAGILSPLWQGSLTEPVRHDHALRRQRLLTLASRVRPVRGCIFAPINPGALASHHLRRIFLQLLPPGCLLPWLSHASHDSCIAASAVSVPRQADTLVMMEDGA